MKFLIDANLPYKLAESLKKNGFDVVHTDDFPYKERTKDSEIRDASLEHNLIVITKDTDFLDSHVINQIPKKLLLISTGNITNKALRDLFEKYFYKIVALFVNYDLIEMDNDKITVHEVKKD